jgi:L-alanine-DL-glutamate epimerase-like enolase superfamily enzyme
MKIESIETAYYRLPLEPIGDAGHGYIDSEELIILKLRAGGLEGHGYAYTIGRGGHAVRSLIDRDIAPLLLGLDAEDIQGLWDLMWQRLLYVGRGGLASFSIGAVDIALWDLKGLREQKPLYALVGAPALHAASISVGECAPQATGTPASTPTRTTSGKKAGVTRKSAPASMHFRASSASNTVPFPPSNGVQGSPCRGLGVSPNALPLPL